VIVIVKPEGWFNQRYGEVWCLLVSRLNRTFTIDIFRK